MKLAIYKHFLGSIMSQDRNFLNCWREKIPCKIDERQKERDSKGNSYSTSLFCPDKKSDPNAICVASRLHISSHENFVTSSPIDKVQEFFQAVHLHTNEIAQSLK
jgi:hypothetical protein